MKELIDALYLCAQETRVKSYLRSNHYNRAICEREKTLDAFRGKLTEEQNEALDTLLNRQTEVDLLEDEASFLAGVAIGLDLGRL